MSYEPSEELPPFVTAFPDAADVFAGDVTAHRRVLQPLLSIDATAVDPSWSGRLHVVTPLEPYDGLIGEGADAYYSEYTMLGWIAFKVVDSKYEFLGDFRYFKINACSPEDEEFYRKDYVEKEASYAATMQSFRECGQLGEGHPREWFNRLGGVALAGNWCVFGLAVEEEEVDEDFVAHPLTTDGRRFRFVASVAGYNYRSNCADEILLFFDPQTSIAVLTFDWT